MTLKISIITPCLNRSMFIKNAVESTLRQDYVRYEHIIMDGGSTDETLSVLAEYPHLLIFSGKDAGMYDAINKGLQKTNGEIIGLLNSDDIYAPGIFSLIISEFQTYPEADVITGMASYFQGDIAARKTIKILPAVTSSNFDYLLMKGVPIINAWFFRRSVFEKLGLFDESFFIAADREFQARCLINKIKIRSINRFFYHYRYHQDSMTVNNDLAKKEKYLLENLRVADKYAGMDFGNKPLRSKFESWKDSIIFELSVTNFRRNNLKKFFEMIWSAIKEKPLRILSFAFALIVGFPNFLYRYVAKKYFPSFFNEG